MTHGAGTHENMINGINHITISVKSLNESFQFYSNILGFKPLMKTSKIAYFLAGDLWFCLDEDPHTRLEPLKEYTHVAFTVSIGHLNALRKHLEASHVEIWKKNNSEGESIYFLDPNGHKLEVHVGDWKSRLESIRRDPWDPETIFYV